MNDIIIPRPEEQFDHWTSIPNLFFDVLQSRMEPATFSVLMVFARKLYGFHKDSDYISSTQIAQITGLSHKTTSIHLNRLLNSGILKRTEGYRRGKCSRYEINTGILISL